MKAYATAIYLRIENQDTFCVNLVYSKMRLASKGTSKKRLKQDITLPRLELLAVTVGVGAANFVASELRIASLKRILWTDSTCVLHWLKTRKPLPVLVDNRIKEVLKANISFHYVPSNENPADLPTRDLSSKEISEAKLWWYGPSWLKNSEDTWPEWCVPPDDLKEIEATTSKGFL